MAKKTENIEFSKAFQELEKLSQEFEQGDLDLETSIKKFERGVELAEVCKKRLSEVENSVKKIQESFNKS